MRFGLFLALAFFAGSLAVAFSHASAQNAGPAAAAQTLARGRYLVVDAGQCMDCHGPKLAGSTLDFLKPGMPVAYKTPAIAGLPMMTAAQAATFLQTGTLPNGKQARPPMPQYRFSAADAGAIVAYLKSLH